MEETRNKLRVDFAKKFNTQLEQVPTEFQIAFSEALELFLDDTNQPNLRNHALREKFAGYRSIDVTDDWRALFKVRTSKTQTVITFHILGTHTQLYG